VPVGPLSGHFMLKVVTPCNYVPYHITAQRHNQEDYDLNLHRRETSWSKLRGSKMGKFNTAYAIARYWTRS